MKYELEDRVERFGEKIIDLVKKVKITFASEPIISQLIRSGTSVGANYFEANGASSRRDFINKVHISKKEVKETQYWLKIISRVDENIKNDAIILYREAQELGMIFSAILTKTKAKLV